MERGGPVHIRQVFTLRDGLPKPKKKGKAPLLKRGSLYNRYFEGKDLTPMLK